MKVITLKVEESVARTLVNMINAARLGDDDTGDRVVVHLGEDGVIRRGSRPAMREAVG